MASTAESYRQIFSSRTPEEIAELAQIKRFMERLVGDPGFRRDLHEAAPDFARVTRAAGIDVDPDKMLPLFHTQYIKYRHTPREAEWPLSLAWSRYMKEMATHRGEVRDHGATAEINPRFHAWRERQIARSFGELGASGQAITHPLVAYELSDGCTVGCWFCGLSADRFKGAWPYTEDNAALWRGVLQVMVDRFGAAAETGFCYWATDPMDNPDYDRFIADHWDVVGFLPQTTTAAPLKNVELTRRVLALFDQHKCITNRFSVLSTKMLQRIHDTFTADELMGVELVPQMKDAISSKADAGRARVRKAKLREAGKDDKLALLDADHSTIACVSGFLINMPQKTVKMVAPTRAGERWPLGYRVYEEARFETADELRALIDGMVERHGGSSLTGGDVLAFRPDLEYRPLPDGFEVGNNGGYTRTRNDAIGHALGRLIADGTWTAGEIHAALIEQGGDIFMVADLLNEVFAAGLLDDDPASGKIGRRSEPAAAVEASASA